MAEIIEVKNSREKAGGYSKELSEKLFEKKNDTKESFKELYRTMRFVIKICNAFA